MRNFFIFIWRNQFTFLFLLLELIGFILLVNNNPHQQSVFHSFSVAVAGNIYDIRENFASYLKLDEDNQQLREENARLKEMLEHAQFELPAAPLLIKDTTFRQQYDFIPAKAVNSTLYMGNNYLIINKGNKDGVGPQMGVTGPGGAVGIVQSVSQNYAAVMSLVHTKLVLSCRLKKNNYFGLCRWEGSDPQTLLLDDIPNHVNVIVGDEVVTRGASGIFPEGVLVGKVKSAEQDPSSGFYRIEVNISTNFRNLTSVYVIQNSLMEEQTKLEASLENEQ